MFSDLRSIASIVCVFSYFPFFSHTLGRPLYLFLHFIHMIFGAFISYQFLAIFLPLVSLATLLQLVLRLKAEKQ